MTEPDPAAPPPLRARDQAWRLAACLVIGVALFGSAAVREWDHPWMLWVELGLGVAAFVIVLFRRRWPMPVALTLAAFNAVSGLAAGPATLAAVSLATRRRWFEVVLVGIANSIAASYYVLAAPYEVEGTSGTRIALTTTIGLNIAIMGWGMYIGSRRELVADLKQRALRAEAEQELRIGQARATERTRIAREMHDVVAHRISLVSLQAGALAFREDLEAPRLRRGLEEIQGLANTALDELRGVLGLLRDDTGQDTSYAPQPTYADLTALLGEARDSGMQIVLDDTVARPDRVPDGVGRTMYRIVQEAVTNARKHAPGQALHVTLGGRPGGRLTFSLTNRTQAEASGAPGAGLGLVGLRERVELSGGRLYEWRTDDDFSLEGWLPWQN